MTKSNESTAYCIEYFYAKPDCSEALKSALLKLATASRKEAGCLQYDVLIDREDSDLFILILKFDSHESMTIHESQQYISDFVKNEMNNLCRDVKWHDAVPIQ